MSIFLQYGPEIMIDAGRGLDDGQSRDVQGIILSLPLTATNAVGSIVAIFTIERIGRRKSMLYSIPLISFFLLLISIAMHLSSSSDNATKFFGGDMLTFAMILYFLVISFGFHSACEAINSEIYPIHLIGTAQGISIAFNWLANFSMASIFLTVIEDQTGIVIIFILMAVVGAIATLFVYTQVPETGGIRIQDNVENCVEGRVFEEEHDEFQFDQGAFTRHFNESQLTQNSIN